MESASCSIAIRRAVPRGRQQGWVCRFTGRAGTRFLRPVGSPSTSTAIWIYADAGSLMAAPSNAAGSPLPERPPVPSHSDSIRESGCWTPTTLAAACRFRCAERSPSPSWPPELGRVHLARPEREACRWRPRQPRRPLGPARRSVTNGERAPHGGTLKRQPGHLSVRPAARAAEPVYVRIQATRSDGVWSPDGKSIVFDSEPAKCSDILP